MEELFARRLTELIKGSDYILSDMEDAVGKTGATISRYASGEIKGVKRPTIVKLANFFGVSPAWLAGLSDEKYELKKDKLGNPVTEIPLLGTVKAGYDYLAQENRIGTVDIDKKLAETGDFFALRVKGDSMVPIFFENDIVIIRKQNDCENNEVAVVIVNGDEGTLKKVKKLDNGGIKLIPYNRQINQDTGEPYYEDKTFSKEDIRDLPVIIVGVFEELRRKKLKF